MSERLPSLLAMRAFEAAARRRSIKEAAAELEVTPAAVSQQIKKLEAELGVELLTRGRRQLAPTQLGRELQAEFEGVCGQLQNAINKATAPAASTVTVGTSPSFSAKCILPRLSDFMAAKPDLHMSLVLERNFKQLLKQNADIMVIFLDAELEGYEHERIREERLVPLASPALIERYGISEPRDLVKVPLLADDSMKVFNIDVPDWEQWLKAVGLSSEAPNCTVAFDSNAGHAIDAAVAGYGVLLGRQALAFNDVRAGRLVELFEPALSMPCAYYLMAKADKLEEPAVRQVWDWLAGELFAG